MFNLLSSSIIIFLLNKLWKAKFFIPCDVLCYIFWWGCRGNLKCITLGSERVNCSLVCRGILSVAWCPQDPDLLLSCGKVNSAITVKPHYFELGFFEISAILKSSRFPFVWPLPGANLVILKPRNFFSCAVGLRNSRVQLYTDQKCSWWEHPCILLDYFSDCLFSAGQPCLLLGPK